MPVIAVFCGSSSGGRAVYADAAREMGRALVARGFDLVYGAGNIGLMGILANATLEAGGKVIGVIPQTLVDRELAHQGLTELHIVDTMHQRKALMADRSNGFIALPGGYGTLDELFEILTWAQLGIHRKPIGLLNVDGFFNPLLGWIGHAVVERFVRTQHVSLLNVANTPEELLDALERHTPAPPVTKWADREDR